MPTFLTLPVVTRRLATLPAAFGLWLALGLGLSGLGACGAPASESAPPLLDGYTSTPETFDTRSYYYDTGSEVVVFDAQFTEGEAQKLLAGIRARTASPVTYVVITHPNPDKFNGAAVFQRAGARVVASAATAQAIPAVHTYKKYYFTQVAKSFTESTYPAEAHVDVTFTGRYSLPLAAGARVELHELQNAGVTTTQTVAHIPERAALVVGDLVHYQTHAWLEGGIVAGKARPDLSAWQRALSELSAFPGTTVYGGRGAPAEINSATTAQAAYLSQMQALVRGYVEELGPRKSELADSQRAATHYHEITRRAQAAFPEYGLPYLVEYGVYGLANSLAGL